MNMPTVSFVIPCYKLGHLLSECVNSILSQTYTDFEVLIMDDQSPDNTAKVASSFSDDRVRYIRNEHNLGPLRNYNTGITLSRGKYVWLISADDFLRKPYVLQRYVSIMDCQPNVGYTFCPGVRVSDGVETDVVEWSVYGRHDRIVHGHTFLKTLLRGDTVLAPSALVRRECYDKVSLFPLNVSWAGRQIDMIWAGDWYLWCMFALEFDVAYCAEPMVCYREHALSMTDTVTRPETIDNCAAADISTLWMVRQRAIDLGLVGISKRCLAAVAGEYARHGRGKEYRCAQSFFGFDQFEESLCKSTRSEYERNWIRARFLAAMGDRFWSQGDRVSARRFYLSGLEKDPLMAKVYVKLLLACVGKAGECVRRTLRSASLRATRRRQVCEL